MNEYMKELIQRSTPLKTKSELSPLIDSLKEKKIIMIGESSHGNKDFYEWRHFITQELITKHGFNFIAAEADWPSAQKINQFARGKDASASFDILTSFNQWPAWVWANTETMQFIEWLQMWNQKNQSQIGFHGLDVYSFFESMDQVLDILKKLDPDLAIKVEEKYSDLESYRQSETTYTEAQLRATPSCQREILNTLKSTLEAKIKAGVENEEWFDSEQKSLLLNNAERYYRAMVFGEDNSWNVREEHMMSVLTMLLKNYGRESKGIIWEHNSHVGDYRATSMVTNGEVSIGGLVREIYGKEQVALIGFGTYVGTVTASYVWEGPTMSFDVPEANNESLEYACHSVINDVGASDFLVILESDNHHSALNQVIGHRAIGIVYDPATEHWGNYVPTSLGNRYDWFIFLNRTEAIIPFKMTYKPPKSVEASPRGERQ